VSPHQKNDSYSNHFSGQRHIVKFFQDSKARRTLKPSSKSNVILPQVHSEKPDDEKFEPVEISPYVMRSTLLESFNKEINT